MKSKQNIDKVKVLISILKVSQIVHGSLFRSESIEFDKQSNFVLIKYPPINSYQYWHNLIPFFQVSPEALRPIFTVNWKNIIDWITFIENVLIKFFNNFYSIYLNKIFTSKKLSIPTEIRLSRRSISWLIDWIEFYAVSAIRQTCNGEPWGMWAYFSFVYQSIQLNKLKNFALYLIKNVKDKKGIRKNSVENVKN